MARAKKNNREIKCVISYSHKDETLCGKFTQHLTTISKTHPIKYWLDKRIKAGQSIDAEVRKNFNVCDIVFILVSHSFINSNYCYEKELKMAYRRHNKSECVIIPVILSEISNIDKLPFGNLNRVPEDGKPIRKFGSHEAGLNSADKIIIDTIEAFCDNNYKFDNSDSQIEIPTDDDLSEHKPHVAKQKKIPTYEIVCNGSKKEKEITQTIVNNLPAYYKSTTTFVAMAQKMTNEAIENYKKSFSAYKGKFILKFRLKNMRTYLFELANIAQKCYIGDVNVRIHFRRLNGDYYEGIVVSGDRDDKEAAKDLTRIPSQSGMIFKSGELDRPLLRSFNRNLHTKGHNDNIWVEHLTCAINNITNSKTPVLSMGISLNEHSNKSYKPILILMANTRFDLIIKEFISQFTSGCQAVDKNFDIGTFISAIF